MHRLAYRNFGTHESLVAVQTVDVNATPPTATSGHLAGARYFELRRTLPGGSWTVNEEADMRRLLALGVDGLVTDRADLALRVVAGN